MKITQLDIEGFRSLKKVSWKPGDLNVIIGPNGSGKSNLLRMLELISASAQGRLSKHVQAEGGMGAILWDGEVMGGEIKSELILANRRIASTAENYYQLSLFQEGLSASYRVRDEALALRYADEIPLENRRLLQQFHRHNAQLWLFDAEGRPLTVPIGDISAEETLLAQVSGPFTINERIPAIQKQIGAWGLHQDVRVDKQAAMRQDAVARFEQRVNSDGQNLINVLHTLYTGDREFKQQINSAMQAAFGGDFEELIFPPASDQRIQLRIRWKTLSREQSAADLSDGTLRFLFLLAVLASPSPAPLIAIDEPETGLHPSMLPIIAEFAVEAARKTQVIFTTHSDQFLDAFRDTRPTTTVAKWEDGETTLTTLPDEDLAYWLKGYSMGSLFRTGELEALA